jgi:hypothetical protein
VAACGGSVAVSAAAIVGGGSVVWEAASSLPAQATKSIKSNRVKLAAISRHRLISHIFISLLLVDIQ